MKRSPMKRTPMKKTGRPKMTAIRKSARGQECQVRVPGICNGNPETVVLAHLNGGGVGGKSPDWQSAFSCSSCHNWLDGGYSTAGSWRDERDLYHLQGVIRTQARLIGLGLIEVKGAV